MKYLFFWGHRPAHDGSVTASCLSQWWEGSPFTVDGRTFATAEHYMMWSKAMLFGDSAVAERVLVARHPRQAKALGREVSGFDEAKWVAERYGIVVAGSVAKFGSDPARPQPPRKGFDGRPRNPPRMYARYTLRL